MQTFGDYLMTTEPYNRSKHLELYSIVLKELGLYNKVMDGDSIMNLPKTNETDSGIVFTEAFNYTITLNDTTPCDYVLYIIWLSNHKGYSLTKIKGVVSRGLRAFPSFLRELDFNRKLSNKIGDAFDAGDTVMDTLMDVKEHVDIKLKLNNEIYNLWLFQSSKRGIYNTQQKLSGKRGKLKKGYHVLCPIDVFKSKYAEKQYNWYFYNYNYIDNILNIIKSNEYTNYNDFLYDMEIHYPRMIKI